MKSEKKIKEMRDKLLDTYYNDILKLDLETRERIMYGIEIFDWILEINNWELKNG